MTCRVAFRRCRSYLHFQSIFIWVCNVNKYLLMLSPTNANLKEIFKPNQLTFDVGVFSESRVWKCLICGLIFEYFDYFNRWHRQNTNWAQQKHLSAFAVFKLNAWSSKKDMPTKISFTLRRSLKVLRLALNRMFCSHSHRPASYRRTYISEKKSVR